MAKKIKVESLIALPLKKFEDKLNQFQTYLEEHPIQGMVLTDKDIKVASEWTELNHKEIAVQIKMQEAVLNWLPLLEKLKQGEAAKNTEVRGESEIGGMYKKDIDG